MFLTEISDATVTLVFICGIETVHFFCTKKPIPILGYNREPVWITATESTSH